MNKFLKKWKAKGKTIWKIIKDKNEHISFIATEEQILTGQIEKAIIKSWRAPTTPQEHDFFRKMVENIHSAVTNKDGRSVIDIVNEHFNGPFMQAAWFYSFLCGFVCYWEFNVRMLAERHGTRIKKTDGEKSKKEKKMGVVAYRDISDIIKEFQQVTNNKFKLNLEHLSALRNALVHGNLQQLRRYANYAGVKINDKHKGNVYMFNPADLSNGVNLSDVHTDEVREGMDMFSWFIEGTNSSLLKDIFHGFEQSMGQINTLISFKSLSFDERESYYKKVMEGNKLSSAEEQNYQDVMKLSRMPDPDFFKKLYKCFIKIK